MFLYIRVILLVEGEKMEFRKLSDKEFKEFEEQHEQSNFNQTVEWGKLKKYNGWDSHLLGMVDKDKVVAASLVLSKKTPIGKKMFYAPHGFLIDYNNYKLLENFVKNIREYAKKENAIFIKIDPYIIYQERDLNGDIVEGGKNNKKAYQNLIKLGFKHFGFNMMQETLQPRWVFVTDTKNKTVEEVMANMESKTRQIIRKNERECIETREIGYEEIELFKDIMSHTGDRRGFIDRPLSYYQNMYKELHDSGILKILIAELNIEKLIKTHEEEIEILKKDIETRKYKHDNGINKMNEKKYLSKQKQDEENIKRIEKKLKEAIKLSSEHGDKLCLGGILFLIHGKEVVSLVGGSYDKYMEYQSAYTVHWAGCKYAIENGYDRYNFYGITGVFDEKNPLYGLYSFKRGYGGKVVELIGEFDLVISKFWYIIYKIAFKLYHGIKNIKNKE